MAASTAMILLNKAALNDGFAFPLTLTGLNQLACVAGGLALSRLRALPPVRMAKFAIKQIAPLAASNGATLYMGVLAYVFLSVAFVQMLKSLAPAITLLVTLAAGLETPSWELGLSVGLIAMGAGGVALIEARGPAFHPAGVLVFLASALADALRVVMAQAALGAGSLNTAELLVFQGGPTAAVLLLGAYLSEWDGLWIKGFGLMARRPLLCLSTCGISFLVQLTGFFAIKYTSSLSFKVASIARNAAVMVWGVAWGDRLLSGQLMGYGVSIIGVAIFLRAKREGVARPKVKAE
eukprot:evm.model.scf_183.8 EVM.evm.TU.scf_183.8   scf_183:78227-79108(+)